MAVRAENKQSTPKIALSSADQDAIRRERKKAQKANNVRARFQSAGFQAGLQQDRLNRRGVALLDLLELRMVSSAPSVTATLHSITTAYVESFVSQDVRTWHKTRHQTAKAKALIGHSGGIASYAERQLDRAFAATHAVK